MQRDVPAAGYILISGKRAPPDKGQRYHVQFRCGWIDHQGTYPVKGTRWIHDGRAWDIVAVRRDGDTDKTDTGRQADGSYE